MTDTVVVEGQVKFRDGKKWKTRWVVLQKPSPVADCLSVLAFKERKKGKEKGRGHKERLNVTLEDICGVDSGPGYDGVAFTLSILSLRRTLVLGFHSRDALLAWDARIRYSLGEVHRFSVDVQPGTSLEAGPASLHLCNNLLALSRGPPPVVIGHWKLSALRRYGAVPDGFVFEGGTRCGYWAGVFFLSCSEGEQISFFFDCIVRGFAPSRAPRGVHPVLPDPNADAALAEERISQEASELEKRLSMLSHCSRASSAASTYSCGTSVAGDDRSSISSSSSSQSDASFGSRLPLWVEPGARLHLSNETASSASTLKCLTSSDDRLYAAVTRPSSSQLRSRGLHDSGRQSSLDSGIGIATSSQSSYSGSFSSCTGSLDVTTQGGGEEFGSASNLPVPPPAATPPPAILAPDHRSAVCSCASRPSSQTSGRNGDEYQTPSLLRLWYDTPRSLLQTPPPRESSAQGGAQERAGDCRSGVEGGGTQGQGCRNDPAASRTRRPDVMQRSHSWGSERAPPVASEGRPTPRPLRCCLVCGETQCCHAPDDYVTPEQWRSARTRCLAQVSPSGASAPAERAADGGDVGRKTLPPTAPPPPPPDALIVQRPKSDCGSFPGCGFHGNNTVNYVNIPMSLAPAKVRPELLYMELDLPQTGSAAVSSPHSAAKEDSSIRYAHLDIAAMETAQRVGAEHVQGREDKLTHLESRRRGPPD